MNFKILLFLILSLFFKNVAFALGGVTARYNRGLGLIGVTRGGSSPVSPAKVTQTEAWPHGPVSVFRRSVLGPLGLRPSLAVDAISRGSGGDFLWAAVLRLHGLSWRTGRT